MSDNAPRQLELMVPAEHPCFADHFPQQAIVPGALLLQWLCCEVEALYPGQRVGEVKSMKFLATLGPADCCVLMVREGKQPGQLKLELTRAASPVCRGTFLLCDAVP